MKTLNDSIHEFITHCRFEKNLSPKTIKAYKTDLTQLSYFIDKAIPHIPIGLVDKTLLRAYFQSISNLKPKSINRKIATAKALFNFLDFEDIITLNPFRKLKIRIKEQKKLPNVLNISEIQDILKSVYKQKKSSPILSNYYLREVTRDIAIVEVLFATGVRVSELAGLNCTSIDIKNGLIKVLGKGSKERVIQICHEETLQALQEYFNLYKDSLLSSDEPFFLNRLGNRLSEQSIRSIIKKYSNVAGLEKRVTPHVFRHSFATLLLEKDVDIRYIQHMLGHSSVVVTQIYTHVNNDKQKTILSKNHPRNNFKIEELFSS